MMEWKKKNRRGVSSRHAVRVGGLDASRAAETLERKDAQERALLSRSRSKGLALILTGLALTTVAASGCSRDKYRTDADKEVYGLLNTVGKSADEKYWDMNGFTLAESSKSRYANRYNPDAQPSPVDDQTAARLLNDVEGRKGREKWSANGFAQSVENESWRDTLPEPNEDGEIVVDQKVAFDLALLHSPDYRNALENVYLAALNVTAERYAFDVKFYGGSSLFYRNDGGFKDSSVSTLEANSVDAGARRKLATGADVVVSLANSMVWTFSPANDSFAPTTSLSYSLTQPFLRGAGRAIVLEDLTRSERRLLANVRQLAFYQQGFYVGVLTGSSPISAPSSGGYPGSGVGGANVGGFYGLLSSQIQIRNQESNVSSSEDNYQRYEGYYETSRVTDRSAVDRMRQNWLSSQERLIELKNNYRNSIETYLIDLGLPPDVENVVVRDSLTEQFNLMPETLGNFQADVTSLLGWLRDKNNEIVVDSNRYINSVDDLTDSQSPATRASLADLRAIFADFDEQFGRGLRDTLADLERLENEVVPRRLIALDALRARFERDNPDLDSSFASSRLFEERVAQIREDLERPNEAVNESGVVLKSRGVQYDVAKLLDLIEQTILTYSPDELAEMIVEKREHPENSPFPSTVESLVADLHMTAELNDPIQVNVVELERELAALDAMAADANAVDSEEYRRRRAALDNSLTELRSGALTRGDVHRIWFSSCLTKLSELLLTLHLIQARARLEVIELPVVDVQSEYAFQVARERRLDWMNMRSNLVDQWRNIEIVADQLRSDLSVSVGGSISNEGSNPVNFSSDKARFTAGVQFDAPLDRFMERNSYRQALIAYDQARRGYYAYVDGVHQQIRSAVRAIELAQVSFELQRDSVLTSIKRVHYEQLKLAKPPKEASRINSIPDNTEALVDALETLLNSQNQIMQTWLQYQSRRMNLMLHLGVFHLDETGRWVDPGNIDEELLRRMTSDVGTSQDALAGLDRLPTFEELSGGRSPEAVRQMTGDGDGNEVENAPEPPVASAASGRGYR